MGQHGMNHSRSIAQTFVDSRQWRMFISRLQSHISLSISKGDLCNCMSDIDRMKKFISHDVRSVMRPSKFRPASPGGLFICDLYDEYHTSCGLSPIDSETHDIDQEVSDPLFMWNAQPTLGMVPATAKLDLSLLRSALKPIEGI